MRAADLLVKTLKIAGVNTIYTLSGNQIMPVFDACIDHDIRLIHTRHEAGAVFMAEAHAMLTGEIGVALVTAAPGFTNALGPLYNASQSESPVLLLTGDSPVNQDGMGAFQELDQVRISAGLVRHAQRVTSADQISQQTAAAIRHARTRPGGPVHLALPGDVLVTEVNSAPVTAAECLPAAGTIDPAIVDALVDALAQAQRPLIITGPSGRTTTTGDLSARLTQRLAAPVVCMESPRGLNDPANGALKKAVERCDLVVSLGKRPDFSAGFANAFSRLILVHPDTRLLADASHRLNDRILFTASADPVAMMQALADTDVQPSRVQWLDEVRSLVSQRAPVEQTSESGMHPAQVGESVQRVLDDAKESILVIDGGEFGQWSQASTQAQSRIINGPSGAIGGGLCYAIAAKLIRPNATVIAMMGDGTVGFHFSEFETAARYGIRLIAVIGHDARWNAEYQIQLRDFGADRLIGCELGETRYDQAAAGLGCFGAYAQTQSELDTALTDAIASNSPACIVARIQGLSAPTVN